jgi:hypothetical protein
VRIVLAASRFRTLGAAAGRAARLAAEHAPAGIDWVVVSLAPNGSEVARVAVLRGEVEKAAIGLSSPEEIAITADLRPALPLPPPDPGEAVPGAFPRLSWTVEPRVILSLMDRAWDSAPGSRSAARSGSFSPAICAASRCRRTRACRTCAPPSASTWRRRARR